MSGFRCYVGKTFQADYKLNISNHVRQRNYKAVFLQEMRKTPRHRELLSEKGLLRTS